MKKIILILLLTILTLSLFAVDKEPYFKEDVDVKLKSHIYLDTVMLFGYPTIGASMDIGLNIDTVTIAGYLRFEHLFRPQGSNTGRLAVAEEMGELGLSFKVRLYELGRFNVSLGINTGWYQQWIMLRSNAGIYNLVHNGLMIRPECSIGWRLAGGWNVELGFFYQSPLYPFYDGYQGWGVQVKLV